MHLISIFYVNPLPDVNLLPSILGNNLRWFDALLASDIRITKYVALGNEIQDESDEANERNKQISADSISL